MEARLQHASGVLRASLVPLAITAIAGYTCWAGALLTYDASGGLGPLAAIGDWPVTRASYTFFYLGLAPLTYAVATWRLNARGALIALAGVGIAGPVLWSVSPWSTVDVEARLGYYDETRGWIGFGLLIFGIGWFFIAPPLTYGVRWAWRKARNRGATHPAS